MWYHIRMDARIVEGKFIEVERELDYLVAKFEGRISDYPKVIEHEGTLYGLSSYNSDSNKVVYKTQAVSNYARVR